MKCHNCEYEWVARISNPKSCPECKTRLNRKTKKSALVNPVAAVASPAEKKILVKPKMSYSEELNVEKAIVDLTFAPLDKYQLYVAKLKGECERDELFQYILSTVEENRKDATIVPEANNETN